MAVSFYIKTRWHNISLLQVTCNYLRTAKENGRQVYFLLLSFLLFNQTWQVTGMSIRAGWKRMGLIVLTVWYGLAFFAISQTLMFPSKRLINPFIYRLQQPLGEKKNKQLKQPNKQNPSNTNTGNVSLFSSFWVFYNSGEQKQSHVRKYLAVFLADSSSISHGSHPLSVQKFAFLFNVLAKNSYSLMIILWSIVFPNTSTFCYVAIRNFLTCSNWTNRTWGCIGFYCELWIFFASKETT